MRSPWYPSKTVLVLATLFGLLIQHSTFGQTKFSGTTMGPIVYNVTVVDDVSDWSELDSAIKQRLEKINQLMSTYIDDSDVSRINVAKGDTWVSVDPLTLQVINRALELSKATHGAFDITVGPAVDAWKFGPDPDENNDKVPSDSEIAELKSFVGYQLIETRDDSPAVRKKQDLTKIDLSAIAKGFAVDRVAELLLDRSYANFMVEVGGEVTARGKSSSGERWRIGIEQPVSSVRKIGAVVDLNNNSLATSGDYRNFRVIGGKKFSHAIDPVTCKPVQGNVASATVLAEDCMTADALATAIMVMGDKKGMDLCSQLGVECSISTRNASDSAKFSTASTKSFPLDSNQVVADEKRSIWPAFVGALVIFGLAIAGMAVGSILNNRPISGSCGGIAATTNEDGSSSCSMCEKPVAECPENQSV